MRHARAVFPLCQRQVARVYRTMPCERLAAREMSRRRSRSSVAHAPDLRPGSVVMSRGGCRVRQTRRGAPRARYNRRPVRSVHRGAQRRPAAPPVWYEKRCIVCQCSGNTSGAHVRPQLVFAVCRGRACRKTRRLPQRTASQQ